MNNNNNKIFYTFIFIKPDAYKRGLSFKIIQKLKKKGYKIKAIRNGVLTKYQLQKHYEEHKESDFFNDLINRMENKKSMLCVLSIDNDDSIIKEVRRYIGATDPKKAAIGTIRQKYGTSVKKNVIHASDSHESARREIKIWFPNLDI